MEPTNTSMRSRILEILLVLTMVFSLSGSNTDDQRMLYSIRKVFRKYKFHKKPGFLQFWLCNSTPPDSEEGGYILESIEQVFESTQDHEGLQNYGRKCVDKFDLFVGRETDVGNWFAGRAAQTGIADHRTKHLVLTPSYQHSAEAEGMGQLVMPVYIGRGAEKKLFGIIELVTADPKESYTPDFKQLEKLLKGEGLYSKYMGKTIKVDYGNHKIRFTLPFSAKFTELHRELTKRFNESEHTSFCIKYTDTNGDPVEILNDEDLRVCMEESSLKVAKFIHMYVC